ncbi:hypothetical protein HO173_000737 [Letharia columbiana]|uniref:Uncharacterized protein n=1 Tax=Letharia columbiana TaxID=112416 RepID=A0A8H6G5H6_9LECA|nr:uncharacterized protein HO173_000737 [Letharia columbiana]KAF6240944.1 hypothetical protein HO173_000737 [Letharia columbiana]
MIVPKMSRLRPGVSVNIVLKADQRSGRLTSGSISEILTRGDHPRGIKVRLTNGQVGRVQSLSAPSQLSASSDISLHPLSTSVSPETYNGERGPSKSHSTGGGSSRRGGKALQDDYRQDPTPLESRSLADYIRLPSSPEPASAPSITVEEPSLQTQMESEYPKLDSALIAAIVADYPDPAEAKNVLSALS